MIPIGCTEPGIWLENGPIDPSNANLWEDNELLAALVGAPAPSSPYLPPRHSQTQFWAG